MLPSQSNGNNSHLGELMETAKIAQALGPAVDNAADWDVLVAHGLGVDHAGHTHDVDSPQMLAKLRETDAHIKQASTFGSSHRSSARRRDHDPDPGHGSCLTHTGFQFVSSDQPRNCEDAFLRRSSLLLVPLSMCRAVHHPGPP